MWDIMDKWTKAFIIVLGVAMLGVISVPLVYSIKEAKTPKFEGVVSQIIESEERTTILFEDGKSTFFLKPCDQRIGALEVGDTLTYISEEESRYGARCRGVRSSSDEATKKALYEQRIGTRCKGVVARIEFGYLRSFRYRDASVLFTNGKTKVFSLANNPQMACAEVGDTIVYKGKRCVSLIPHVTEQ